MLWFTVDITIVNGGEIWFINQRSHHWGAIHLNEKPFNK